MRRWIVSFLALTLCVSPLQAGGKTLLETWDVAYLGDGKAGYVHTIAKEIEVAGETLVHTTVELRLTLKRFSDVIEMSMDTGSIDTKNGKVVGVFMKQYLGKKQQLHIQGTVADNQIELTLNGKTALKPAPWDPAVMGLYKQQTGFKDRQIKPGDKFTLVSFEPTINVVIKANVTVKGERELMLPGDKKKRKLLLVETI